MKKVEEITKKYQEVQIVANRFQTVIMSSLGLNLICSLCLYHIFLIYLCIKLHDYLPGPLLGVYGFWAVGFTSMDVFCPVLLARIEEEAGKIVLILAGTVMRQDRRIVKLRPISVKLSGGMRKLNPLLLVVVVFRISRYLILMF